MIFVPEEGDLAPCGIYCPGCIVYKASNNKELAEKIAENMGVDPEYVQCDGCRAEGGKISVLSMTNLTLLDKKGADWLLENVEELMELYYEGEKEHGGSELEL